MKINDTTNKWIYEFVVPLGTTTALTAILNSNIEVSLKIAFCASIFILRGDARGANNMNNRRYSNLWACQRLYFIKLFKKIAEKNKSDDENELNFDSINSQTEYLEWATDKGFIENDGIGFLTEFIICLGISMAIVKYALPLL